MMLLLKIVPIAPPCLPTIFFFFKEVSFSAQFQKIAGKTSGLT